MPTYQYACTECGHTFEQFQNFSEDSLTECPECAGKLRKLFNAVGVVFKGSGFYRNDSRPADTSSSESKPEKKADAKPDSKPVAGPDRKTETKSESKPAAATPA